MSPAAPASPPSGGHRGPAPSHDALAATARRLLGERTAEASICPSEVVRCLWRWGEGARQDAPTDGWRAWMPAVRAVAADLAEAGVLRLTRGADDVTPDAARDGRGGPIRLRRGPRFDVPPVAGGTDPAG